MNQQVWTFYDQRGIHHSFGIYHGELSGHFIAYLDDKILIIDFGILADKRYSFFFERELLHFDIIKKSHGFEYSLIVDKKSDTEFNRELKKEKKEELHIILLILLIIIAVFLTFYFRLQK